MRAYAGLRYSSRMLTFVCLFVALSCLSSTAFAQLSTASLSGAVRDSSGAVIANSTIVLRNVDTTVERASVTNSAGEYAFLSIAPGRYTLEAKATGFSSQQIAEFPLTVGQTATMNFTLGVGTQTQ